MICKNCGAVVSEDELLCPYCKGENFDVAKKQQEDYVNQYRKKQEDLKKAPEKVVKKTTKYLLYGAVGLLIIFVLTLIVVFAFSKVTQGDMLAMQEMETAKLEEYYIAGDYENMCKYLDKIGKSGGSYEKYWRIYWLYSGMDWKIEALKNNLEYAGKIELDVTTVEDDLERCMAVLSEISAMEELDFPYGEEDGALYVKNQYVTALKNYMFLTEDEIESAISIYSEDGTDYLELAEIAISRMEENAQ